MSQPAIIVEGISKRYRLGHQASPHQTFREMATGLLTAPFRKLRAAGHAGNEGEDFWALKDVSFEVQPGEVVGIIGRNGAGKSTLLKILSRITEPTRGQIRMRGRVASLLEVGTGFHPELTGRENIYLNGAILGMKRAEITKKFDEIVAFAETEKFLDTPVKFYSSGMYVRLAFAVAAHLDPEILIVDEVLAVGDAEFQKKCLGKMKEVSKGEGRTVLFVSHNIAAIQALCDRGVLIREGKLVAIGPVESVTTSYLKVAKQPARTQAVSRSTNSELKLVSATANSDIEGQFGLMTGAPAYFTFRINLFRPKLSCAFTIYNSVGQPVSHINSKWDGEVSSPGTSGDAIIRCCVPELLLMPGEYRVNVAVSVGGDLQDHVEGACVFDVGAGIVRSQQVTALAGYGVLFMPHQWVVTEPVTSTLQRQKWPTVS